MRQRGGTAVSEAEDVAVAGPKERVEEGEGRTTPGEERDEGRVYEG